MPSELEAVITSFLNGVDEPPNLGDDSMRYWQLAGQEVERIVSGLGGGTPILATVSDKNALLCLSKHGPALITTNGNRFVVHHVRCRTAPTKVWESGPMVPEFGDKACSIELDVPGLPGPIVVSGLSQADIQPRRDAIFLALAD
jgi:hypothetical protein